MSYDIYIGNGYMAVPTPVDDGTNEPHIEVKGMVHPEAPEFPGDTMTGKGNSRHPGYSQWSDFCEMAGLHDLFFGARWNGAGQAKPTRDMCLMRGHPGCALLQPSDLLEIRQARERWEAKPWPTSERIPGWDPNFKWSDKGEGDPRYDNILARLLWLEWWVTWALANCETPCLFNR